MLPGMRQVQQLLLVRAPGARGEGVQHRLPDVGRAAIDQDNACLAATTQRVPKTGCQDQSGNPATGDQYGASSLHSYPSYHWRKTARALNLRIDYSESPVIALQALHERSRDREYREFLRRLPGEQYPAHP